MQRKGKLTHVRARAVSQRPSKAALNRSVITQPSGITSPLLISKAPVYRYIPKPISEIDLAAENDLLRRRSIKLTSVFKELKSQFTKKQEQVKRLRDIAEFVGVFRGMGASDIVPVIRDPMPVISPNSENEVLKRSLHNLERVVTELRLQLYRKRQEFDTLSSWLARMGLDELSDNFVPSFDIDSMSYEELLALEERIGYVKIGLSASDRETEELCCVCLQEFEIGQSAKKLPGCGHHFHAKCIDEWLEMKKTCPLCVTEVQV